MRRKLQVADLGDLLDQPLNAILAISLANDEVLLAPVWYEWRDGGFSAFTEADGVKHRYIERDPRVSIVVAENGGINRGIEVRGIAHISRDGVNNICRRITSRYLPPELAAPFVQQLERVGMVHVRIEPGKLRAWDFADEIGGWREETVSY